MILIHFCDDKSTQPFGTDANEELCIENVLVALCKSLNISPLCRQIFGLRTLITSDNKIKVSQGMWLSLSRKVSDLPTNTSYQFRIRFIPQSHDVLKKLDVESHKYFFYQIRYDFLAGWLPELTQQPKDGLGLVVTDILHHLLIMKDKCVSDLDISTFIPKSLKSIPNKYNVKSTTENLYKVNSENYIRRGPEFIRSQYMEKVEEIGKITSYEKYLVELEEGSNSYQTDLIIDPFHPSYPGLYYKIKKITNHVCTIDQLVFVSVRMQDLTVEISRGNGVPCYLVMSSKEALHSLVGCLSGYYRLMKTWTFDLCRELPTPSLHYLRGNKCHGPVGKEFVKRKLMTKGGGEAGVGVLRCSSSKYDEYTLTVLRKENQPPHHYEIRQTKEGKIHFKDSEEMHDSLHSAVKWAIKTNFREMGLKRVLPPSDLDITHQLLIYASSKKQEPTSITAGPRVMHMDQFIVKNPTPMRGTFSDVYQVKWGVESSEDLAIKVPKLLKHEKESYLNCLNKFLCMEGDCVVKVYGVTLNPLSLVMEYLPLGPLNTYLKKHASQMRQVDLVEASSYLAKALWDLRSKGITHHNIRCHNVLVADHTHQRFKVKLGDPGKVEYSLKDIHWLPREHLLHPPSALTDPNADTFAFGTTLWEIFSLGEEPLPGADVEEVRAVYAKGSLLPRPHLCPNDLYKVMIGCWHPDPHARKHPQAIMRDVKQIFYLIFNSRRENPYQKVNLDYAKMKNGSAIEAEEEEEDDTSTLVSEDQLSVSTQMTSLTQTDGSVAEVPLEKIIDYPFIPQEIALPEPQLFDNDSTTHETQKTLTLLDLLVPPPWETPLSELTRPPPPLELTNCSIEILTRIGKGNYGYVFKGKRTFRDRRTEYVALKRLQSVGNTNDFKKEMDIMKNLSHENIVQFHCLAESDQEGSRFQYMVMEYLSLGSLQDYLQTNKEDDHLLSDKNLLSFAMDIAKGMDYLENKQIIHRDLAARNVLVASEEHVKITDFGLAQRPNHGSYYILRTVREMPIRWYALESIEIGKFSLKSDVWSFGVTLWEMFTRGLTPDLPNDGTQLIQALKNGTRLVCKAPCKPFIYSNLIRPCWDEEPAMRPEFTTIMSTIRELQEELW